MSLSSSSFHSYLYFDNGTLDVACILTLERFLAVERAQLEPELVLERYMPECGMSSQFKNTRLQDKYGQVMGMRFHVHIVLADDVVIGRGGE